MKRLTFVVAPLLLAAAACSEHQPTAAAPEFSRSGLTVVSLSVVVSNTDSLGNPMGITNDGQGAYVDGAQNVQAQLDGAGTFAFNTLSANHGSATRWLNYDFSHPVDPNNTFQPIQDHTQNYHFSTGGTAFSPTVPLQNLGVNGNPSSQCMYMGNGFAAPNGTTYRVSYHKGLEDTQTSPTAFAVFTRVSVSPAVWTAQPVGSCSPNSNVASLRNNATNQLYGYYTIPFYFTLTAK